MKKRTVAIIVLAFICCLCMIGISTYVISNVTVRVIDELQNDSIEARKQTQKLTDEIEIFFKDKGYDINIIGAHTNGREHEGPFLYGWCWKSFEIGTDVIMLYHYHDIEEVNGYLSEMDDETKDKCFISKHFVFYYRGEDADIINTIKEFCETSN